MREGSGLAALRGLRGLTEDRLQDLIAGSFAEVASQIEDAGDRLAAIDAEAGDVLRPLVEQLAELKFSRRYPDEDVAGMLLRAGQSWAISKTRYRFWVARRTRRWGSGTSPLFSRLSSGI